MWQRWDDDGDGDNNNNNNHRRFCFYLISTRSYFFRVKAFESLFALVFISFILFNFQCYCRLLFCGYSGCNFHIARENIQHDSPSHILLDNVRRRAKRGVRDVLLFGFSVHKTKIIIVIALGCEALNLWAAKCVYDMNNWTMVLLMASSSTIVDAAAVSHRWYWHCHYFYVEWRGWWRLFPIKMSPKTAAPSKGEKKKSFHLTIKCGR